jgi:hypothetical protein
MMNMKTKQRYLQIIYFMVGSIITQSLALEMACQICAVEEPLCVDTQTIWVVEISWFVSEVRTGYSD